MPTVSDFFPAAPKTLTQTFLLALTPDRVRAYRGAARKCCCGCAGKYYEEGEEVAKALKYLQSAALAGKDVQYGERLIFREVGRKVVIVYLRGE